MGVAFISTNWKARGITGDWDDKNNELINVKIMIRDPNYIEELKNTSGYLYKLKKHEFKIEPYETATTKGVDMYYTKKEKIIEEIFIENVYEELVNIGVEFMDIKDYNPSNEEYTLSIEWYNDNVKEEDEVKVKQIPNDNRYDLKSYYYAGEDGYIYKQLNLNDRVVYKPMRGFTTKDGYIEYVLTDNKGKKKHIQGQRLVALTYHGKPKEDNYQVNHKNGNRADNRPDNLEWLSPSENIQHSFNELGKIVHNAQHIAYVITDNKVMPRHEVNSLVKELNEHLKDNKLKVVIGDNVSELPKLTNIVLHIGNELPSNDEIDTICIGCCETIVKSLKKVVLEIDTVPSKYCNRDYSIKLEDKEIKKLLKVLTKYERK